MPKRPKRPTKPAKPKQRRDPNLAAFDALQHVIVLSEQPQKRKRKR